MKKILLYTDTPQTGGAELQIFLLAKFLNKELFTPILACSKNKTLDKWCEKFNNEGIKVVRINAVHKHDPRHYFQLRKIIKKEKIDILHLHVWNPGSCRYGLLASKNIPLITTEHDPFKLSLIKDTLKKSLLKNVKKIITVSNNNKRILKELYPNEKSKIIVIHNGIDTSWWQSQLLRLTEKDRKEVKENIFQSKENTLTVTTIAELHERKGIKYLIRAIPKVVEEFSNVKFIIIGEGSERSNLEKLSCKLKIKDHIIFLGKQKEIPKLLNCSDIFVLPSKREAFGLVNAEAMITGLPIIATNVGGIPEIVENGKTGIIVKPENPLELTTALKNLIADSEKRGEMGSAGRHRVIQHFSAKKMAEEYEKIYMEIYKTNN